MIAVFVNVIFIFILNQLGNLRRLYINILLYALIYIIINILIYK